MLRLQKKLILLPIPLLFLLIFSLGVSLIVSSVAVDIFGYMFHLYSVFTTAWSFLTPIFYPISIVPEEFKQILLLNPLYYILLYFREIILNNTIPSIELTILCFCISFFSLFIGVLIFRKLQNIF